MINELCQRIIKSQKKIREIFFEATITCILFVCFPIRDRNVHNLSMMCVKIRAKFVKNSKPVVLISRFGKLTYHVAVEDPNDGCFYIKSKIKYPLYNIFPFEIQKNSKIKKYGLVNYIWYPVNPPDQMEFHMQNDNVIDLNYLIDLPWGDQKLEYIRHFWD